MSIKYCIDIWSEKRTLVDIRPTRRFRQWNATYQVPMYCIIVHKGTNDPVCHPSDPQTLTVDFHWSVVSGLSHSESFIIDFTQCTNTDYSFPTLQMRSIAGLPLDTGLVFLSCFHYSLCLYNFNFLFCYKIFFPSLNIKLENPDGVY